MEIPDTVIEMRQVKHTDERGCPRASRDRALAHFASAAGDWLRASGVLTPEH
jgi:hypothetical protein